MNLRYINRTDRAVIGACALSLTFFSINAKLDSVIPLYLNGLIVLSVFTYWAVRRDPTGILKRSLIIGSIAGASYAFVDKMFVETQIITYLRPDVNVFETPASVVLIWMCSITIVIYFYQRLRPAFNRFYMPSALTGASAFISGTVLNELGDHARLWVWNVGIPSSPAIGSTPLFVPIALFVTFFLSPYIIGGQHITPRIGFQKNSIAAGLRCAIILAATIFLAFRILTR